MKAVICTNAKLEVTDQPTPTPAKGQLLIDVLRCGICGSDLHARKHCGELADVMAETGYPDFMRSNQSVVFGHEFCGEVLDHGPGTRKALRAGTPVVALPLVRRGTEVHAIGLTPKAPGGYAEQLIVEQSLALPIPNGLPATRRRRATATSKPRSTLWVSLSAPSKGCTNCGCPGGTSGAPLFSRVVVVGVCMGADRLRPSMAINKEIDLRFVLGYTPMEFRDTLHMLADGKVDAKILVDPKSDATKPG